MSSSLRLNRPVKRKYFSGDCFRCIDWLEAYVEDFFSGPELIERYRDVEYLARELHSTDVVLLKGSWLLQQYRNQSWLSSLLKTALTQKEGFVLPPRAELPREAIWDPEDLMRRMWRPGCLRIKIVAVPLTWQTSNHPDPHGTQTNILVRVIEQWMNVFSESYSWDLALFIDFCSLPQCDNLSKEFAEHIDLWFAHQWTDVWLMPRQFPRWLSSKDKSPEEKSLARLEFYNAISRLEPFGQCKCVLDLSKLDRHCKDWSETESACAVERLPSLPPEAFRENLRNTACGHEVRKVLERIYTRTFEAFTSHVKDLVFHGSSEDADKVEQLANVLPYYKSLNRLFLSGRQLQDYGVWRVVQVLPQNGRLCCLHLDNNEIGPVGVSSLADALPKLTRLVELCLQDNHIGVEGIGALGKVLIACPRLAVLQLDGNDMRSEGVEKLAKYLPSCRRLAKLHLCRNRVEVSGARALAKFLPDCSSLVQLWLDRNVISDAGVNALTQSLEESPCLEKLSLADNSIGNLGGRAVADAVPVCHSLEALSLLSNSIDDDTQNAILQAWAKAGKKMESLLLFGSILELDVESGQPVKKISSLVKMNGEGSQGELTRVRSSIFKKVRIIAPCDTDDGSINGNSTKENSAKEDNGNHHDDHYECNGSHFFARGV